MPADRSKLREESFCLIGDDSRVTSLVRVVFYSDDPTEFQSYTPCFPGTQVGDKVNVDNGIAIKCNISAEVKQIFNNGSYHV